MGKAISRTHMKQTQLTSRDLVIASTNKGKINEFRWFLRDYPFQLHPLDKGFEVTENGATFLENAALKALGSAKSSGYWSLADDSGLCVEALNGAPGIYS